MNAFNQRVLHGQREPVPGSAGDRGSRWTLWAKRLRERYERVVVRPRGSAMILAQPAGMPSSPGTRWIHAAWTISPHIHLSIQPLLQRAAENGGNPAGSWERMQSLAAHPAENGTSGLAQLPSRPATAAYAPLEQVFARAVRQEASQAGNAPVAFSIHNNRQVLQRVVDNRKRIEQHSLQPPAALLRPGPTGLSPGMDGPVPRGPQNRRRAEEPAAEQILESPPGWRMGAPGMSRPKAAPEIDLERLTEEVVRKIDERIVAHRERLGRAF